MEAIDVLLRRDRVQHPLGVHMLRQGHLHQNPVNLRPRVQLLDDGQLTDGKGRTVDFKNVVVIMTSNLGSQAIADASTDSAQQSGQVSEGLRRQVTEALRRVA